MATDYVGGFSISEALGRRLDLLVETGLYGDRVQDVVEALVQEGILRALADGLIQFDQEVVVGQASIEGLADLSARMKVYLQVQAPASEPTWPPEGLKVCDHTASDLNCGGPGCKGSPF